MSEAWMVREGQERGKGRYLSDDVRMSARGSSAPYQQSQPIWSQYQRDAAKWTTRRLALQQAAWVGGRIVRVDWANGGICT